MNLKAWGRIGGLFGTVVLFSAVFNWLFVTGSIASAAVIVRLVLGAGGIAFWLITNRGEHPLGRGAFFGTVSVVSALVLVAALAFANYLAVKKPKSWDLTKDKIFTLSDQTVGVLKGLKDEVKVQAFYAASEPEFTELDQRLRQYKAQSDKLTVEFVDPFKHPALVKELNISQSGPRVIVKSGSKEARGKEVSEEGLTNALIDVTRGSTKKIYFSKGHGEHPVADATERGLKLFVDTLKSEGFQADEMVIAEHKEMPADAAALVIAGPVAALTEGEARLVKEWVEKGGKLVALVDPSVATGLESAFESWGIKVGKDEVIDPEAQNPEVAIAQQYTDHPITQPRSAGLQLTIFPVARSVSKLPTAPAGWTDVELARTGPRAWGETSSLASGRVEFNEGQDLKGPVPLAVAANKGESRVVVIGNSLFAANGYFRLSGNRDFAVNSVSWAAKEESRISIRPKQRQSNHLFLSADQKHRMTLFAFDLLPFGLLFAGLVVWQTRKSR
jgi:ABC-type uncharacterized transport system involved in gliding motility auxiliary subunit